MNSLNSISVVILTFNEAINIADCLESCRWCDDVHVLDSGSQDATLEIARRLGAHTHVHRFESFGAQRNWALDHIRLKHDWVFHLDADERITPSLVAALLRLAEANPSEAGFYVPEKVMFMGKWIKRSTSYPKYQMRFFHRTRMRFRNYGHGQRELTGGSVRFIDEPYLHLPFSKGLDDWIAKHNQYSELEAQQILAPSREPWTVWELVFADRVRRRRAWKEASHLLPFRPFLRWFATLFLLGGILDGKAGRVYARLMARYEEMTTVKLRLLREQRSSLQQ